MKERGKYAIYNEQEIELNKRKLVKEIIKKEHIPIIIKKLSVVPGVNVCGMDAKNWFVADDNGVCNEIIFDEKNKDIRTLREGEKACYLQVIYLSAPKAWNGIALYMWKFEKYGLMVDESAISRTYVHNFNNINYDKDEDLENSETKNCNEKVDEKISEKIDGNIQDLLDCDKKRCGLASYEKEMLEDIKAGHWDLFEKADSVNWDKKLVARDPKLDIKKNGIIGIVLWSSIFVTLRPNFCYRV